MAATAGISEEVLENLITQSMKMKERSYCPYSNFRVGCALFCKDGTVITGCNVENVAYGPSICAERTAVVKAVSEGHRTFKAVVIASDLATDFIFPCGVCRQVLAEFGGDCEVYMTKPDRTYLRMTVSSLLPGSSWSNLKDNLLENITPVRIGPQLSCDRLL